ncbi:uncharacterized protein AAEQ78_012839 [Lycaon pictus]
MPPTPAASTVSLRELADLAIGTPEAGAVNFTALHTLIVAMLRSLNLQELRIDFQSPEPEPEPPPPQAVVSAPQLAAPQETRPAALESQVKGLGGQVHDLSRRLKTITSQVQGIVSHVQHLTAPAGLAADPRDWLDETVKLAPSRSRVGSLRTGKGEKASVAPVSAQVSAQATVEDVKSLQEAKGKARELPGAKLEKAFQRIDELEKIIRERDEFLDLMSRKLSLMPVGEEVTMVTWEELEQAITDGWRASQGVNMCWASPTPATGTHMLVLATVSSLTMAISKDWNYLVQVSLVWFHLAHISMVQYLLAQTNSLVWISMDWSAYHKSAWFGAAYCRSA